MSKCMNFGCTDRVARMGDIINLYKIQFVETEEGGHLEARWEDDIETRLKII